MACVVVVMMSVFSCRVTNSPIGMELACLFLTLAAGFIIGVSWAYTLGYHLLREHPTEDSVFWREAFLAQARLLRLVPYWYVGPLAPGLVLLFVGLDNGRFDPLPLMVIGIAFWWTIRLNRSVSRSLEQQAQLFA